LTGERGETTTQLVLVTPVLMVLVLSVVQLALWWHAAHLADAAAGRAATVAAQLDASAAAGVGAARSFLAAAGTSPSVAPEVVRSGDVVRASVTVDVPRVLPGFPATVRRTSVAPVERFIPESDR
jgi:hypothetical protein